MIVISRRLHELCPSNSWDASDPRRGSSVDRIRPKRAIKTAPLESRVDSVRDEHERGKEVEDRERGFRGLTRADPWLSARRSVLFLVRQRIQPRLSLSEGNNYFRSECINKQEERTPTGHNATVDPEYWLICIDFGAGIKGSWFFRERSYE